MSKTQSKTIHIGNMGEHLIGSLLSQFCIVRSVAQGRDTGIDLYCEILKEESLKLSLHFFCQVKTTRRDINFSAIKKYFDYWRNQPAPVFLFHVKYKDIKNLSKAHEVWVYGIPYALAIDDAEKINQLVTRDVDVKIQLCGEDNNKNKMTLKTFLYGHVPWSYGLWQMRHYGLVYPNPEIIKPVDNIFVGGFSKIYKDKIEQSIEYANWLLELEGKENHTLKEG